MSHDHSTKTWIPGESSSRYIVEVIRKSCVGDGSCVAFAPEVFELDEENIARIKSQTGNDDAAKLLAAQVCPVKAIRVIDTETGEQVWPLEEDAVE
jgi:ferredoxin